MQNQIPKNWQKAKLGDYAIVLGGKRLPKSYSLQDKQTNHPYLRIVDMTENGLDISRLKYISDDIFNKISHYTISDKDLYISIAGTIGFVGKIPKELSGSNLTENCAKICNFSKDLDKNFLLYFLKGRLGKAEIKAGTGGSSQPKLALHRIENFQIPLPPTSQQQKIALILTAFDDKIEVNNKIAITLEQMAQAIFKEWFIIFKFPGYDKVKFSDSELGKIPEGWKIIQIKDVAKVNKGLSYSSKEIDNHDGLPMINLANFLRGGGFNPLGVKHYSGNFSDSNLVKSGNIIIALTDLTSNREIIGHPARVPTYGHWDKILISLDVCSIQTDQLNIEFLYYLMLRKEFSYLMASSAGGTNVSHLSPKFIENYHLILPSKDILKKFKDIIVPIYFKKNYVDQENQKLAALRDLLLPKLMRGEIRV